MVCCTCVKVIGTADDFVRFGLIPPLPLLPPYNNNNNNNIDKNSQVIRCELAGTQDSVLRADLHVRTEPSVDPETTCRRRYDKVSTTRTGWSSEWSK